MGVSRKQSTPKFPKNKHFCFFGNFGVLYFLEPPVLGFALLPYYRRFDFSKTKINRGMMESPVGGVEDEI